MSIFEKLTEVQGFCNARGKLYPTIDGKWKLTEVMTFTENLFNPRNLEEVERFHKVVEEKTDEIRYNLENGNDTSKRRALHAVFDKIMCNHELNMFVTLTCNKEVVDRYSYDSVIKYLNTWLSNRVQRNGLKYVLVPERHKDGAIHLHGIFNREALKLHDSGRKWGGKVVWNVEDLEMGHSTAVQISGEREHVAKYVVKYIVKAVTADKIGGRYQLSGGELIKPKYLYATWDYLEAPSEYEFMVCEGVSVKIHNPNLQFRIVNSKLVVAKNMTVNTVTGEVTKT